MSKLMWMFLSSFVALALESPASAALFVGEQFDYVDGDLTNLNAGDNVSGGLWDDFSGTGRPIQVTNGQAIVEGGGGSASAEDAHRSLSASQADGATWYYAAKISVIDKRSNPNVAMGAPQYFLGFKDEGTGNLNARLWVNNPAVSSPTTFSLAITAGADTSGGARVPWTADLTFGQEYVVVVGFRTDSNGTGVWDGEARLWVDPASSGSPSVVDTSPASTLTGATDNTTRIFMRQGSGAASIPTMKVDAYSAGDNFDEVFSAVPEPATLALASLAAAAVAGIGRKRR